MDLDMKHFVSTFEIRKLETGMVKRRLFWRLRAISSFIEMDNRFRKIVISRKPALNVHDGRVKMHS